MKDGKPLRWRLLRGDGGWRFSTGCRVMLAGEGRVPFEPDAVILEDDTYRVLSADPDFQPAGDHPIRVMTEAWSAKPLEVGSVYAVEKTSPVELHVVIYDLSADPIFRSEWVDRALGEVLSIAEERGWRRLVLPILGRRHGQLTPRRFAQLLLSHLARWHVESRELWVVAEGSDRREFERLLGESVDS